MLRVPGSIPSAIFLASLFWSFLCLHVTPRIVFGFFFFLGLVYVHMLPPAVTLQLPSVTHQPPSVTHQPPSEGVLDTLSFFFIAAPLVAVAGVLGGKANAKSIDSQLDHNSNDGDTSMRPTLPWVKSAIPVPDTFVAAWDRVKSPVIYETRKNILDGVPLVKGIPELALVIWEKACYEVI